MANNRKSKPNNRSAKAGGDCSGARLGALGFGLSFAAGVADGPSSRWALVRAQSAGAARGERRSDDAARVRG